MVDIQNNYDKFAAAGIEVLAIFREEEDAHAGLLKSDDRVAAEFPMLLDYDSEQTSAYSPDAWYNTYIVGNDGNLKAALKGTKTRRPYAAKILKKFAELEQAAAN